MPLSPKALARAFEAACRAELDALKPGNVHRFAPGHGMETRHFEDAAHAAAGVIARPGLTVGARIAQAVDASFDAAGLNTNLGIILLCAPLAAAALAPGGAPLRDRLAEVLASLDVADARDAFGAIARANPGGLGAADAADVRAPAAVTLKAAMALAAARDLIARQYVTDFADIFTLGVPALDAEPLQQARVEAAYLAFLSAFPDSHVARKFGAAQAEAVRQEAIALSEALPALSGEARHGRLLAFDARLKAAGLNPGTSADLTVASIFTGLILKSEGSAAQA